MSVVTYNCQMEIMFASSFFFSFFFYFSDEIHALKSLI